MDPKKAQEMVQQLNRLPPDEISKILFELVGDPMLQFFQRMALIAASTPLDPVRNGSYMMLTGYILGKYGEIGLPTEKPTKLDA